MAESSVEPATSAKVKTTRSMAGSARDAIITSRLAPMPPKLVPASRAERARKKRALPIRAVIAMRSAQGPKGRPKQNVGTRAVASQMKAKIR